MPSTIHLAPLTPGEFAEYLAHAVPSYAREKVASGQWTEAEALELAHREVERVLPLGLATAEHHLFSIRHAGEPASVGMVWMALQDRGGKRIAYIFDVWVWEQHRRKGYAAQAFSGLEQIAQDMGLAGVALHVFGHNAPAQALYLKLGYKPTNINMFKELPCRPNPPK